ncbi:HdaA/DnaA family protein [Candidatus Ichthyocystis hellenicum]|uniref:HdaA/DnaA family protein n=1 Tax=Candidatus Ichthyocystis hellenicum TaxID=1561003 RepID=UPI000B80D21C|nr:DnaA/Hda family protein [Candidatus Ichthyocystis hellenicum]
MLSDTVPKYMQQSILDITTGCQLTLGNFFVGQNKELIESINKIREGSFSSLGLYLFGAPGCGRTHLLQASIHGVNNTAYVDAGKDKHLRKKIGSSKLVAIDNIDRLSPGGQIKLFDWFNRAAQQQVKFILSGNKAPLFMSLREDLRTRVATLLAFPVHPLSDDQKVEVVKKYAQDRGINLKESTVIYLLNHVDRNLSNLIDWLNRLDHLSLSKKKNITAHFVRAAIESQKSQDVVD